MDVDIKGKAKEDNSDLKPFITGQTDVDWAPLQDNNLPRPFDLICSNLTGLGALSIDDFLNNAPAAVNLDINFHLQLPEQLPMFSSPEKPLSSSGPKADDAEDTKKRNAVALLRQTCQSVFGSSEVLNYEYLEEDLNNRQCILTITRPGGATRSYKSESGPLRRGDAKAQAAQVAIEMGAIDFIVSGDSDALKAKKGLLLNPLQVDMDDLEMDESKVNPLASPVKKESEEEIALREIELCCMEWRAGMIQPHWVYFNGYKDKKKHGAALKIALNAHVFRAYSVDPVYINAKAAKLACAAVALKEGVLDFIKYGNGQTGPIKIEDNGQEDGLPPIMNSAPPPALMKGVTLQEYYETLPKPFPEDVGDAPAVEINAPAWLNLTMQSARGARLVSNFTPIVDSTRHLHGHILRIERPDELRTYLVDPQFPKRGDAKSAVCLLAMSQGVGDYIRGLKEEAENKLPADRRKLANEKILQVLATEYSKVRHGNRMNFIFPTERDAFGCTLKVDISSNPAEPDIREYNAKTEYRNKADAKAAVACIAAEQGLIDLLRFRGATPPADYVPFWEAQVNGDGDNYVPKRKEPDREALGEDQDRKKRRKGNNDAHSPRPVSNFKLPEEHPLPPKPAGLSSSNAMSASANANNRWKKPHVTGPRGLGPSSNAYAPMPRSGGQDRSGHRSGGVPHPPHHSNGYPAMSSNSSSFSGYPHHARAPPPPPPPPAAPHSAYPYDDRTDYRQAPVPYPPVPAYPPPDPYGNVYPSYPAAAPPPPPPEFQAHHYPSPVYHTPPAPAPPAASHHYPAHYAAPPPAPPTPPHTMYGHYPYSVQYPQPQPQPPPPQYPPHPGYPVSYPSPHPVMFSPPAPVPVPVPVMPPSPSHYASYSPSHRPQYETLSPPPPVHPHSLPPKSPPRQPRAQRDFHHHAHRSSYPSPSVAEDYAPTKTHWQMNGNYRRHSTTGDSSRGRATSNNYRTRPQPPDDDRNQYMTQPPSPTSPPPLPAPPPVDDIRPNYGHTSSSSNLSVQPPPHIEQPPTNRETLIPTPEPEVTAPVTQLSAPKLEQVPSQSTQSQSSQSKSSSKTNVDILFKFCEKERLSKPTFYHKAVEKDGKSTYMVWVEKDAHRFELQHHFSSVVEGHEKLSKRVLQWNGRGLQRNNLFYIVFFFDIPRISSFFTDRFLHARLAICTPHV
ncbi:hypothetical protein CPB84DRAFT_337114 [Gymnopilus junonius]|uniref:Uncharacterized protein n=1 Tax=Gymnopilus junonius TaxID=109634 RepID=A0A9P5TQA6_GYMJU|nr:hypothetical protein CPB84DRAFT_337114 [Gymnopilus junonius]